MTAPAITKLLCLSLILAGCADPTESVPSAARSGGRTQCGASVYEYDQAAPIHWVEQWRPIPPTCAKDGKPFFPVSEPLPGLGPGDPAVIFRLTNGAQVACRKDLTDFMEPVSVFPTVPAVCP